jgi:hypothetical protein
VHRDAHRGYVYHLSNLKRLNNGKVPENPSFLKKIDVISQKIEHLSMNTKKAYYIAIVSYLKGKPFPEKIRKQYYEKMMTLNKEFNTVKGEKTEQQKDNCLEWEEVMKIYEDLDKDSLLSCVKNYLNKLNLVIEEDGSIKFNVISELNETPSIEHKEILLSLIGENQNILPKYLTKYNIKELSKRHVLKYVPRDSYNFYLVLTPNKKFFINKYFNHLDSDIQETFRETIILNGYLKMGLPDDTEGDDTEVDSDGKYMYYITDLIYLADEGRRDGLKLDLSFTDRETLLNSLRIKFAGITEITFIYTPSFLNIKEDAMDIITETEDKNKLLFLDNTNISNSFILDEDDYDSDIIEVQIIEVDHNTYTVTFGYDDIAFESDPVFRGSNLDFIKFEFFEKTRTIFDQKDISVGDYVLIKINRDSEQKIVTNRKISIIEKTTRTLSYDVVVNKLTKKFSPIKYKYFVSPSWMGLRLRS